MNDVYYPVAEERKDFHMAKVTWNFTLQSTP